MKRDIVPARHKLEADNELHWNINCDGTNKLHLVFLFHMTETSLYWNQWASDPTRWVITNNVMICRHDYGNACFIHTVIFLQMQHCFMAFICVLLELLQIVLMSVHYLICQGALLPANSNIICKRDASEIFWRWMTWILAVQTNPLDFFVTLERTLWWLYWQISSHQEESC